MGHFQINTTIKAAGNIDVVNPVALWRPVPSFNSNEVTYQFQFFATTTDMANGVQFKPQDFALNIIDSSLDLSNSDNWALMRSKAESLLEAIPEIGDNVTYVP